MNALLVDTTEGLSGDATAALLGDTTEALSGDSTRDWSGHTSEALSGGTIERLGNAYPLKGQ